MSARDLSMSDLARLADSAGGRAMAPVAPVPATPGWQLKQLKPRHRQIAQLYVSGLDRESIASFCKCTPALITMLLKQPVFLEYLAELRGHLDQDMQSLYGKAIRVVDAAMNQEEATEHKLRAADMVFKATGKYKEAAAGAGTTAEDVVAALLARAPSVAIQVNVGTGGAQLPIPNRNDPED